MPNLMVLRRSIRAKLVLFSIGLGMLAALRIGAAVETADHAVEAPAVESGSEGSAAGAACDTIPSGQAQQAPWHENLAAWKKMEPKESADNSFCYVCHANFETEKLVQIHTPEGIGCETCHGMSDKHSEDEDSLIPPDVIFARTKIALFCTECHDRESLLESDDAHQEFFARKTVPRDPRDKTCSHCHEMEHALKNRTRRWDKTTRQLQWHDGVRMMQQREKK